MRNVDLSIAMDMKTDLVWIIWIWIPVLVVKRKAYEDVDEIEDKGIGDCDRDSEIKNVHSNSLRGQGQSHQP